MGNILEVLNKWLPIIISALSLIMSIITNKKSEKKTREFENEKEELHQRERKIDEMFMRLNSRSNLIPYFHLILDDSKIEKITYNASEQIKLIIGLMNIGKESASNIMIYPMGKGLENYIKTLNEKENKYFIHDYLNKYFALPKECVVFSIIKKIPKNNDGRIADFIQFKIRFRDLLRNLYGQEFEFGYDNYIMNGFNLKSSSGVPYLIEE